MIATLKYSVLITLYLILVGLISWAFAVGWNFLVGGIFHGPEIPLWTAFIVVGLGVGVHLFKEWRS